MTAENTTSSEIEVRDEAGRLLGYCRRPAPWPNISTLHQGGQRWATQEWCNSDGTAWLALHCRAKQNATQLKGWRPATA